MNIDHLKAYISEHNKTHLIFDFDETIAWVDVDWSAIVHAVLDVAREHGYDSLPKAERMGEIFNEIVGQIGGEAGPELLKAWSKTEFETLKGYTVNESLVDYIHSLSDMRLYLLSNNGRPTVNAMLHRLHLSEAFSKVVTHDELTKLKPDPEGMSKIINDKIPLKRYLMVGNSSSDKLSAQAVGMDYYQVWEFEGEYITV